MHLYRSHTCGELRRTNVGERARLSGWVHRARDHGGLLFIDLRDHYGLTQCVVEPDSPAFAAASQARSEWVLTLTGPIVSRSPETVNPNLPTGEVEVRIEEAVIQSRCTDDSGEVQPTLAELSKNWGIPLDDWKKTPRPRAIHFNPIQPWKIARDGSISDVMFA